ncbi:hypothetical protein [Streptomyces sp. NPDC046197]|uniref:hypothetical protein n=1 Tax=Streptomyces sp. NPDC046197 TaxID=3154337 RepID=UPI0033FEC3EF
MPADPSLTGPLLKEALTDTRRLPEVLALFAVRRTGAAAKRSAARLAGTAPAAARAEVTARGRRATVSEGAFVGGPFLLFIPVAFCAALLRQARTVLELAALAGRDPTDHERAAELLVVQGVYGEIEQARQALAVPPPKAGTTAAEDTTATGETAAGRTAEGSGGAAVAGRTAPTAPMAARARRPAVVWDLVVRMARLLGLLSPVGSTERVRRSVQAARWLLLGLVFAVGMVVPLVWLPYMAVSYDHATARLMDRATRFYFAESPPEPQRRARPDPAALATGARALISVLVQAGLAVGVLVTGLKMAGSSWPVLGLVLAAGSVAMGALWHWHRRRRRGHGNGNGRP